jgi:predicted DNA-binding transcriptional regulator AlpA
MDGDRYAEVLMANKSGGRTINEFCRDYKISRAFFYKLQKQNEAPRIMELGARRIISDEAAADWQQAREAESERAS